MIFFFYSSSIHHRGLLQTKQELQHYHHSATKDCCNYYCSTRGTWTTLWSWVFGRLSGGLTQEDGRFIPRNSRFVLHHRGFASEIDFYEKHEYVHSCYFGWGSRTRCGYGFPIDCSPQIFDHQLAQHKSHFDVGYNWFKNREYFVGK